GSIMSKKLAAGLDALVLDVKFGSGAFMKDAVQAEALAESLVATGRRMGVPTTALLTDMNQCLGRMAGNAVEVDESLAALEGRGPADLMEATYALGAELLVTVGKSETLASARETLEDVIRTGAAREKFAQMIAAQGGDLSAPRPVAPASEVCAAHGGYIHSIDAEALGRTIIEMGGGRRQKGDVLDHSTGIESLVRIGDEVDKGQPLFRVFGHAKHAEQVRQMVQAAVTLGAESTPQPPLILKRIASA
ncbi:MAG: hypothetical protein KDA61_18825, partial [Planctomycetales bacterium]|nr:hypothetical protein [Planctomycetales bacterium]